MSSEANTCIVTGANGFVGSRLKHHIRQSGWRIVSWTRQPQDSADQAAFRLGDDVAPDRFKGVRAVVHCAYDFNPRAWEEIVAVNVLGSQKLLEAARAAAVESIVFISSLSAFAGCRSLYGNAKLEIEKSAKRVGATVIRPGLVYGEDSGGMFGRLARQVRSSRFVPILVGGRQTQYLVHEADLANLVRGCVDGLVPAGIGPISAAHEQGLELKEILGEIARTLGKRISFVPVPWQLVWLGLKSLELAGAQPGFRSDSLIGMVYQDPNPSFALLKSLGFQCRPFEATLASPSRAR
jgi:nucleoside-diphosphate-sugar epimerase